ncbi:glucose-1-phosphate thymidylyltransferase [Streptomyces sp. NPDC053367]|uniref:glucose-1-phosphate thymidylyltransferase n=1 Tax=Streptomyces sp. NPDC053367 TaxID=3365700 RepID=UPI0037D93B5B
MKALILAGGNGSRLRPLTYSMPKQLIPIAGRPVLVHAVETIRETGVRQIGVVVGRHADQIAAALGDGRAHGVEITYIPQDAPRGLAHAVAVARPFLGDDDFLMYLGDNVLPDGVGAVVADFRAHAPAAQVAVRKVADPRAFGVVELDEDGRVLRLVEKPAEPASDLAVLGVYLFTPLVHTAVASIAPSARGELEITDALQWLAGRGHEVRAHVYHGYWRDTGTIEDILDCNRELLEAVRPSVAGRVDAASELLGPVVVGEGAVVQRSRIVGPAVIGPGTTIRDSHVGPYTSIGAHCTVDASRLEHSLLMDRAAVRAVHGVHGSVIGRASQVTGAPGRHRLVLGAHATVRLAAG